MERAKQRANEKLRIGSSAQEFDADLEEEDHEVVESVRKSIKVSCYSGNKKTGGSGSVGTSRCCQADNCTADLAVAKQYHRRHKVCERHAKAQVVLVAGMRQRFCQQCSRFHELREFDDTKRSCRRRLAGHNERRRKASVEVHLEGSSRKGGGGGGGDDDGGAVKEPVYGIGDDRGRILVAMHENANYKHFQIR